jgi:hypothetical protein
MPVMAGEFVALTVVAALVGNRCGDLPAERSSQSCSSPPCPA